MGKGHGERLSTVDTAFLHLETPSEHMHTAALFIFDPPEQGEFEFSRFLALVGSRIHLVPRLRQVLAFTPFNLVNPIWVDDEDFDLAYHVRHAALPRPGTQSQLTEYVERIVSRQLDRARPLWELYVFEGLERGRFAILGKTHHAMIDGVSGMDIATVMFDVSPEVADPLPAPEPWHASVRPTEFELGVSAFREVMTAPARAIEAVQRVARAPRPVVAKLLRTVKGVAAVLPKVSPAPRSPLNAPTGVSRRFAVQRLSLADVRQVKDTYGTTVNDVVLAIVADATGRFLRSRGEDTHGLVLRAMVPVSIRSTDEHLALGNRVTSVLCPMPMDEMDAVQRLNGIHESMKDIKESHQAVGADFLIGLTGYAPPTINAMASRLAARSRLYNFVVTNVPGPQVPLYTLGGRLLGAFPFVPLSTNQAYAVGIFSVDGWLNFGFSADHAAMPDLENVTSYLVDALKELVEHAEASDTYRQLARKPRPAKAGNGAASKPAVRASGR